MSDKMVTVATYAQMFEAELAQNLLEREGIPSLLGGDTSASTLFTGAVGLGVHLQVPEHQAQQAAGILAAYAAEAALDRDWEEKAESGQDVWLCSICGEPVSNRLSTCYSCATPREGIRTTRGTQDSNVQLAPSTELQSTPSAPPTSLGRHRTAEEEAEERAAPAWAAGDALARRAMIASLFGLMGVGILFPLACYYLLCVAQYPGELSPVGRRRYFLALFLSCLTVILLLLWMVAGLHFFT